MAKINIPIIRVTYNIFNTANQKGKSFIFDISWIKKDPSHPDAKHSPKKVSRPSPAKKQTKITNEPRKNNNILSQPISSTMTPIKQEKEPDKPMQPSSPDRKIGQKIGMRLRNLLKLPKAHKWVCYEWFYSNIDKYV